MKRNEKKLTSEKQRVKNKNNYLIFLSHIHSRSFSYSAYEIYFFILTNEICRLKSFSNYF